MTASTTPTQTPLYVPVPTENLEALTSAVARRAAWIAGNSEDYGSPDYDETVADFNEEITEAATLLLSSL